MTSNFFRAMRIKLVPLGIVKEDLALCLNKTPGDSNGPGTSCTEGEELWHQQFLFLTFILELLDASGFSLFSLGRIDKDENDFLDSPVEAASHILLCVRTIGIKPIEPPIGDDDDMHKLIFRGSCHFKILSGRPGCENSRTTTTTRGQIAVHPYLEKQFHHHQS